jgi:hypothetical protein
MMMDADVLWKQGGCGCIRELRPQTGCCRKMVFAESGNMRFGWKLTLTLAAPEHLRLEALLPHGPRLNNC